MTAPALITLAPASIDPRTAYTIAELTAAVRSLRPDLRIESANTDTFPTVVDTIAADGHDEIVVVPLTLGGTPHDDLPGIVRGALGRHPLLQIRATEDLGLGAALLEVLDRRLRAALQLGRVRELDGLVLAANGTTDPLVLQAVQRLARIWGTHHKLPVVAAYSSHVPPAASEAVRKLRGQGRRHVAVGSLFLAAGPELDQVTELAVEAGAVAVSGPLGADPEIAQIVLARYMVGALELVPV